MENEKKNTLFTSAKEKAKQIGLAYWPALVSDHGVDPMAFVHAETVLSQDYGLYGGWNSTSQYSQYGVSPTDVAEMWQASGCRNSRKFRFQVAHRIIAKKSDTLPFLQKYQEGLAWVKEHYPYLKNLPRKTIAVLGRVSEETRHLLASEVRKDQDFARIRVRDLDWSRAQELEKFRIEGSERSLLIRAALLPTKQALLLLGSQYGRGPLHPVGRERVREVCPAYPNLQLEIAVRIAFGTSPVAISNHLLTRKEAHQWLLGGGPVSMDKGAVYNSVIRFLVRDLDLRGFVPRDVEVARWLVHIHARGAWSALVKVHRFPDGRTIRYLDLLDEIIVEDLDRGITTGVERAFSRAKDRLAQVDAKDCQTICSNPFSQLPKWITLLNTPAALALEGQVMDHCVGAYTTQIQKGQCLILSVISRHGRSTVEVRGWDEGWWASQHYGYRNGAPPPRHQGLVEAWLRRENQALLKRIAG